MNRLLNQDPDLILAYIEGDLSPEERIRFEQMRKADAQLDQLVRALEADRSALRGLPDVEAPAEVMERVNQMLERQMLLDAPQDDPAPARPDRWRFPISRFVGVSAVAAMLLLTFGLVAYLFNIGITDPPEVVDHTGASEGSSVQPSGPTGEELAKNSQQGGGGLPDAPADTPDPARLSRLQQAQRDILQVLAEQARQGYLQRDRQIAIVVQARDPQELAGDLAALWSEAAQPLALARNEKAGTGDLMPDSMARTDVSEREHDVLKEKHRDRERRTKIEGQMKRSAGPAGGKVRAPADNLREATQKGEHRPGDAGAPAAPAAAKPKRAVPDATHNAAPATAETGLRATVQSQPAGEDGSVTVVLKLPREQAVRLLNRAPVEPEVSRKKASEEDRPQPAGLALGQAVFGADGGPRSRSWQSGQSGQSGQAGQSGQSGQRGMAGGAAPTEAESPQAAPAQPDRPGASPEPGAQDPAGAVGSPGTELEFAL